MTKIQARIAVVLLLVIAGGILLVIVMRLVKPAESPLPLFANLPNPTPRPTVIGTPILGADIASSGNIGFTIMANGISLVVDDVKVYRTTPDGHLADMGYVFVIVTVRTTNASEFLFTSSALVLVDKFSNEYREWGSFVDLFELPGLPSIIESGQSGTGALVYNVPEAALAQELRLRLEPEQISINVPSVRLEVFFTRTLAIEP